MSLRTEQAARQAVELALSILRKGAKGERIYKTDRDFATATDYAIEDAVRAYFARATPEIGFYGEERGHSGERGEYWCLDPIDGTTNFAHGLPNYGISIALIKDQNPVLGEISLPAYKEQYSTCGGEARLNGAPISVADTTRLGEAVVSVGDFATGPEQVKNRRRLAIVGRLAESVGRVRMFGSAATDLAWLAAGRLDAVVIDSNHSWDVAAGVALARRAGAVVSHIDGGEWSLSGPNLLATNPALHDAVVAALV